ncbi:MAG: flagellar brake protein [Methylobacter sp.]
MTTFRDINLQVGARLQMSRQYDNPKAIFYTELIGYVEGKYLIVKTPFENGLSVPMNVDELVTLRILSGMDVYVLDCRVKHVFLSPHYYMHLSFPTDIQSVTLRSAIRAKVHLPVIANGVAGIINDVSVNGAAIIADKALGAPNDEIPISFEFPIKLAGQNAQISVGATIRNVQQLPGKKVDTPIKYSHGVSFHELELVNQVMLLNLVYESMNRVG